MTQTYSISDLARELDITTRAIRFYEEQNMLSPERRGQERVYSPRDKVILKLILRGKRIGFSLAECRELIELYDPGHGNRSSWKPFWTRSLSAVRSWRSSCWISSRCRLSWIPRRSAAERRWSKRINASRTPLF